MKKLEDFDNEIDARKYFKEPPFDKDKLNALGHIRYLNSIRKKRQLTETEKLEYEALLITLPND